MTKSDLDMGKVGGYIHIYMHYITAPQAMVDPGFSRWDCTNLLFGETFVENCIKMKEIGPREGRASLVPSLDLSMAWLYYVPKCNWHSDHWV